MTRDSSVSSLCSAASKSYECARTFLRRSSVFNDTVAHANLQAQIARHACPVSLKISRTPDDHTLDGAAPDRNLLAAFPGFVFALRGELENFSECLENGRSAVIATKTFDSIFPLETEKKTTANPRVESRTFSSGRDSNS